MVRALERAVVEGADVAVVDRSQLLGAEAVVMQPLACVIDALDAVGDLQGQDVTVLGLGPIGLLFCHVAVARGARSVRGVDRIDRSDCAGRFGVRELVHSSTDRWARGVAGQVGGVIIEAIGRQVDTLTDAVVAAGPGARIHYFGIPDDDVYPVPFEAVLRKRLTISAGWVPGHRRRDALDRASRQPAESSGLAGDLATETFGFDDVPRAFALAARPRVGQRKVILDFDVDSEVRT